MRIVGTDGVIVCDIAAHRLSVEAEGVSQTFDEEALFDTAQTYLDEIVSFLSEVRGERPDVPSLPTLRDGEAILGLVTGSVPSCSVHEATEA